MRRAIRHILIFVLCVTILSGCTEKSKQDADKLTADIVDYTQNKVDQATESLSQGLQEGFDSIKEYVNDYAGDMSEKLVEDLTEAAKDVKDEAEDLGGAVIDDLTNNINEVVEEVQNSVNKSYYFRSSKLLEQHFEKHGKEMGFSSAKDYEKAASDVINNPKALNKTEKEDGDYVYYIEETNEFVILSTDGYIRTYFYPSAGKKYYDKQ